MDKSSIRRVIFNQKGGVGKTTITCNLAAFSALEGKKTLVIDLDPQGNATHYLLGKSGKQLNKTIADYFITMLSFNLFKGDASDPSEFIQQTPFPNLDILPSHPELEDLQIKLETRYKMFKLKKGLDLLSTYDAFYIDTPPAMNFYTRSSLIACNACLIPFDCDDFSRKALYRLLSNVNEIKYDHNPDLFLEGIIVNQYQSRAKHPQKIVSEIVQEGLPVLTPYLSFSVVIRESHEESKPMAFFQPTHKLTAEFKELYETITQKKQTQKQS